jgi:heme A synthase
MLLARNSDWKNVLISFAVLLAFVIFSLLDLGTGRIVVRTASFILAGSLAVAFSRARQRSVDSAKTARAILRAIPTPIVVADITGAIVTASDEAHIRKPLKEVAEGLDPEDFWQVHRGLMVRASAIARAQRDELGRITLHLKQHPERLAVSQAWAWRFKPM